MTAAATLALLAAAQAASPAPAGPTSTETATPAEQAITISCPAETIEAQRLCGDPEIGQAYGTTFLALKAWDESSSKQATVEARRAQIAKAFATNFKALERDGQSAAEKKDNILGYLQYMAEDAQSRADFNALVPRIGQYPDMLDQCAVNDASCTLLASGKLFGNSEFRDGDLIEIAWQKVSLIDDLQGRSEALLAWEIVGPRANLVGFAKTDGTVGLPKLSEDDAGYALFLPATSAGTGRANADVLYRRDNGTWRNIDVESWKEQRDARLPDDVSVWKGVDYADDMSAADFGLWRDSDGNCCPSGGEGTAFLHVEGNRLAMGDMSLRRKGKAALTCPIEQVEYTLMGNGRDTASFIKPESKPNPATSYILEIRHDGVVQRHYGFRAAQGWGGASLVPLDGPGDATASATELPGDADGDTRFYAFNQQNNDIVAADAPLDENATPPAFLFLPAVSRSLWHDGGVNSRAVPVSRISSPLNLWEGNCPEEQTFETSSAPDAGIDETVGQDVPAGESEPGEGEEPGLGYDFLDGVGDGTEASSGGSGIE